MVKPMCFAASWHKKPIHFIQTVFQRLGGKLIDEAKVEKIIPGDMVTLQTSQGQFKAKSIVVAAGPWTPKVAQQLGLELPLQVSTVDKPRIAFYT